MSSNFILPAIRFLDRESNYPMAIRPIVGKVPSKVPSNRIVCRHQSGIADAGYIRRLHHQGDKIRHAASRLVTHQGGMIDGSATGSRQGSHRIRGFQLQDDAGSASSLPAIANYSRIVLFLDDSGIKSNLGPALNGSSRPRIEAANAINRAQLNRRAGQDV
jgi:hypothetical protein